MAPLSNVRHEAFARCLATGMGICEAYSAAGYKRSPASATRLSKKVKIRKRVAELQSRAAAKAEFTIAEMVKMLREDRALAHRVGNPSAAVVATTSLGKLFGIHLDKTEPAQTNVQVNIAAVHSGYSGPATTRDGERLWQREDFEAMRERAEKAAARWRARGNEV